MAYRRSTTRRTSRASTTRRRSSGGGGRRVARRSVRSSRRTSSVGRTIRLVIETPTSNSVAGPVSLSEKAVVPRKAQF